MSDARAILLVHCPDQKGLLAKITEFIYKQGGNITYIDQHVDLAEQCFYLRAEWELKGFALERGEIGAAFAEQLGSPLSMTWRLYYNDQRPRMALMVSKESHCLDDILARWSSGEWAVDIPLIISNHEVLRPTAERFGIRFEHIPVTKDTKAQAEAQALELLEEEGVDFIVLARYMQIISDQMVQRWPNRIINIHHSFLPAFAGAKPYHAAHQRGVKIIGATSHYVTAELDQGPIIEQDVTRVTHHDRVEDLIRQGRDLEKVVLSRAIWQHLNRKLLVFKNRTVVFV
ncbi:MAG: formyltetrahydrofolate deformylase [bacterium]|nr:formyltetrahydrofolate deformylase [bacterium]